MRETRLSGSVEGVMGNHDSYSDFSQHRLRKRVNSTLNEHVSLTLAETRQIPEA
jgi:hypothetical protein